MNVQLFNGWYFLFLFVSVGIFLGLYFILRHRTQKTIKIVLFSILAFALVLHFLKAFIPPYSTNKQIWYANSWFVNICGANIALFPFLFLTKSNRAKDYMFFLGLISGVLSILYPVEPIQNPNQSAEWLDIIRFYIHHNILWQVPLLMVILKVHKLDYRRIWSVPLCFMAVLLFIMINQILQSELGYIALRDGDFLDINYKNTSFIWGPTDDLAKLFTWACPSFFKTVPVGPYAGQTKYWPWFWLIIPIFVYFIPLCFLISLIFDFKHFKEDCKKLKNKCIELREKRKAKKLAKQAVCEQQNDTETKE